MSRNVAGWDRVLRVSVGAPLLGMAWTQMLYGGLGAAALIGGFLLFVTGILGVCPVYALLGGGTRH